MATVHSKVVLLGDSGVGKTSLTNRFVSDTFQQEMDSTMGATYTSKVFSFGARSIKFNIWDTAGQERYRAIAKMYYQDAQAAILVYDITKKDSFQGLKGWLQELREHGPENLGKRYAVLAVVGNKEDLIDEEEVDIDEVRSWATAMNAIFKKTSAKTARGVEDLFREIALRLDGSLGQQRRTGGQSLNTQQPVVKDKDCKC